MSPLELIALSLGASIAVAVVAGLAALGLERVSGDPVLRERAWATALYLPGLPPLAVALMLLTPAPAVPASVLPTLVAAAPSIETTTVVAAPVAEAFQMDWGLMVMAVLVLTGLLVAGRLISLGWRARRLNRLIAHAVPASDRARDAVAAMARGLGIVAPAVRCSDGGAEALLAGLVRPVLILPESLAETPCSPAARAVIAHELAHLKRGDHRAVWVEEAVVALLAVNPVLPLIRARRAAAREEACDALALGGAEPAHRRAYAQSLIEALRARTDATVALPAPDLHRNPEEPSHASPEIHPDPSGDRRTGDKGRLRGGGGGAAQPGRSRVHGRSRTARAAGRAGRRCAHAAGHQRARLSGCRHDADFQGGLAGGLRFRLRRAERSGLRP